MTEFDEILLALEDEDFVQAEAIVQAQPSLLTRPFFRKKTLLDTYCINKKPVVVQWLCEQLSQRNLPIDFYDENGCSSIQAAFLSGDLDIAKILLKYTAMPNLCQWLAQRQLICILGANYLWANNIAVDDDLVRSAESGRSIESAHILYSALLHLSAVSNAYDEILEDVGFLNDNCSAGLNDPNKLEDRIFTRLNMLGKPRVIFNSGCIGHTFTVRIQENKSGIFEFTFYDNAFTDKSLRSRFRGFFTNEIASVRKINVSQSKLKEVIAKLVHCKSESLPDVYKWLKALPDLVNNPYRFDRRLLTDYAQNENNRCYWKNQRMAVMELFIDTFGEEKGLSEFDRYLMTINHKVLNNFQKQSHYNDDAQIIQKLAVAIKHKNNIIKRSSSYTTLYSIAEAVLSATSVVLGFAIMSYGAFCGLAAIAAVPSLVSLVVLTGPIAPIAAMVAGIVMAFSNELMTGYKNVFSRYISNEIIDLIDHKAENEKRKAHLHQTVSSSAVIMKNENLALFSEKPEKAESYHLPDTHEYLLALSETNLVKAKLSKNNLFQRSGAPVLSLNEGLNELWELPSGAVFRSFLAGF